MGDIISIAVFQPPSTPRTIDCPFYYIESNDPGNKIPAFFIERQGASITLLYSHGNAEELGALHKRMEGMSQVLNVNILAYNYSGHQGDNEGTVISHEEEYYTNITAAYNHLVLDRRIPSRNIILYGYSLGSGPSCYLAAKLSMERRPVAGVVLHSAFLNMCSAAVGMTMSKDMHLLMRFMRCPVLMIHGRNDNIVTCGLGEELYNRLPQKYQSSPYFEAKFGHDNTGERETEYFERISSFLYRRILGCDDCPNLLHLSTDSECHHLSIQRKDGIC